MGSLCFLLLLVFFSKNFPSCIKRMNVVFSLAGIAFDIPAASFT